MADRPNHRPEAVPPSDDEPRIIAVVGKDRFPRPGLETFFATPQGNQGTAPDGDQTAVAARCSCHAVGCYVCTCNKVRVCSCDSHSSSSSSGGGCRCAPVH